MYIYYLPSLRPQHHIKMAGYASAIESDRLNKVPKLDLSMHSTKVYPHYEYLYSGLDITTEFLIISTMGVYWRYYTTCTVYVDI